VWPLNDRRIAERDFSRVVVRVPNPLGDQIMATPALAAIRERYPGAFVAGHGGAGARDLYAGSGFFDDFVVSGRREGFLRQARALRAHRFELCILLTGSFRTAVPPWLARIPHRVGYRWSGRTALLTAHWPRPRPGGARGPYPTKHYFLDLVAHLGCRGGGPVRLALTEPERTRAAAWLAEQGFGGEEPLLLLCVGAAFGPSKLWPAEYFARVADHMAERCGTRAIVLCGPGEEEIGARVKAAARFPVVDTGTVPLDLGLLKGVIARGRVLLTNDTGPRHIAAAFGVPVVCLMGPTDPTYTDTDLGGQVVLRREDVECSPCHLQVCPIDHRCLVGLPPERAIAEVERVWA